VEEQTYGQVSVKILDMLELTEEDFQKAQASYLTQQQYQSVFFQKQKEFEREDKDR